MHMLHQIRFANARSKFSRTQFAQKSLAVAVRCSSRNLKLKALAGKRDVLLETFRRATQTMVNEHFYNADASAGNLMMEVRQPLIPFLFSPKLTGFRAKEVLLETVKGFISVAAST